jgi:hypothetical protein
MVRRIPKIFPVNPQRREKDRFDANIIPAGEGTGNEAQVACLSNLAFPPLRDDRRGADFIGSTPVSFSSMSRIGNFNDSFA